MGMGSSVTTPGLEPNTWLTLRRGVPHACACMAQSGQRPGSKSQGFALQALQGAATHVANTSKSQSKLAPTGTHSTLLHAPGMLQSPTPEGGCGAWELKVRQKGSARRVCDR